jgi:drug/metabolite transporter (DMT)-like permease
MTRPERGPTVSPPKAIGAAPGAGGTPGTEAAPASRHALLVSLNFASVYLLWGSTYLAIRVGVQDLPPALMAGSRFLVAGALMLPWLLARGVPLPPRSMWWPIALTGILLLCGGNWLVTWSELTVPSGTAAVIIANLPFFMAGLEALRPDGERLAPVGVLGLLVGFAGMLVLTWPKIAALDLAAGGIGSLRGELALLGANLCWAAGSIYSKHRVRGVAPLMAVALEMLCAGAALILAGLALGEAGRFHLTPRAFWAVAWLVVAGSILGYSSYIWLLNHVPAAKVSTYAYVNPIIAVLLGWIFLDEALDWRIAAGTAIILGGVAVVNAAKVRIRRSP